MSRGVLWRLAASLLPIATGVLGLLNGPSDVWSAATPLQGLAAWSAVIYGALGVVLAGGLLLGQRWSRPLTILWGIPLTLTAGLAPVVWGGAPIKTGILSGLASALIVTLVAWLARRAAP